MLPESQGLQVLIYERRGIAPFTDWLDRLPDRQARARIRARIDRLETGNPGRYEDLGGGLRELKIDWGPGYRVYWAQVGRTVVLLLIGGDKRTQGTDIKSARDYLTDYLDQQHADHTTQAPDPQARRAPAGHRRRR
jgi:putative addiction module killer protein